MGWWKIRVILDCQSGFPRTAPLYINQRSLRTTPSSLLYTIIYLQKNIYVDFLTSFKKLSLNNPITQDIDRIEYKTDVENIIHNIYWRLLAMTRSLKIKGFSPLQAKILNIGTHKYSQELTSTKMLFPKANPLHWFSLVWLEKFSSILHDKSWECFFLIEWVNRPLSIILDILAQRLLWKNIIM